MQKRLAVKPHLSLEEIEHHYRKTKDPVARSHWHIIWLLAQDKTTKQIVVMAILVLKPSCHVNSNSNSERNCKLLLPIRGCGQAEK